MDVLLHMPSCVEVIRRKAAILAEDVMHVTSSLIKKGKSCDGSKNTCISNSRLRSSMQISCSPCKMLCHGLTCGMHFWIKASNVDAREESNAHASDLFWTTNEREAKITFYGT